MTENQKPIFVTINSDAGFYHYDKIGSFAYWIRGNGVYLKGSGVFKKQVQSPWHAEMQAMINALEALRMSKPPPIIGFIFNRDNINARSGKKNPLRAMLKKSIVKFKTDAISRLGTKKFKELTANQKEYAIFRHVKGHSDVDDKRSFVNRWCDEQCSLRLREWNAKQKQKKFEAK